LLALLCAALLIWVGWIWWATRRYRTAIAAVNSEMATGRFGVAARNLEKILAWAPDPDEAAYLLGTCEQAQGRIQAADKAWARVAAGSAFSQRAIMARLRLFHDTGRLAAAEKFLIDAAEDPRNDRTYLLVLLVPIYSEIGRSDEAERLVEAQWEHLRATGHATEEASIKLVRLHIELTWKVPAVESLRHFLDQAGRQASDDDRVWLGRANLSIRTGSLDEAGRWIDACLRRRPDDVPVWKARLNWALATQRIDAVHQALQHIPAAESTPAQVHRLRAWLCSQKGDVADERRELERLIAIDPADLTALDRLVQLATKDGQPARVTELQRQKDEIARDTTRYQQLYERTQPIRDAEEMAHLAMRLGRTFEARVFLTLAISEEPERIDLRQELARLAPSRDRVGGPGQSLAEVLVSDSGR
jgi:enediyne biosynthesis protein E4